mmetsp:Transcript_22564/g.41883  ORF Transcript_22564/g.41883 Transcript_22564/m.41883 type:complete len:569 (-) Transcript_22564:96-1802(-)
MKIKAHEHEDHQQYLFREDSDVHEDHHQYLFREDSDVQAISDEESPCSSRCHTPRAIPIYLTSPHGRSLKLLDTGDVVELPSPIRSNASNASGTSTADSSAGDAPISSALETLRGNQGSSGQLQGSLPIEESKDSPELGPSSMDLAMQELDAVSIEHADQPTAGGGNSTDLQQNKEENLENEGPCSEAAHEAFSEGRPFSWLDSEVALPLLNQPEDLGKAYQILYDANSLHVCKHGIASSEALYSMACCLSLGAGVLLGSKNVSRANDVTLGLPPYQPMAMTYQIAEVRINLAVATLDVAVDADFRNGQRRLSQATLLADPNLQALRDHRPVQLSTAIQRAEARASSESKSLCSSPFIPVPPCSLPVNNQCPCTEDLAEEQNGLPRTTDGMEDVKDTSAPEEICRPTSSGPAMLLGVALSETKMTQDVQTAMMGASQGEAATDSNSSMPRPRRALSLPPVHEDDAESELSPSSSPARCSVRCTSLSPSARLLRSDHWRDLSPSQQKPCPNPVQTTALQRSSAQRCLPGGGGQPRKKADADSFRKIRKWCANQTGLHHVFSKKQAYEQL